MVKLCDVYADRACAARFQAACEAIKEGGSVVWIGMLSTT